MVYLPANGRSIVLELTGNHHVTQIFQVLGRYCNYFLFFKTPREHHSVNLRLLTANTLGHHYALWRPLLATIPPDCREPFSTTCKNHDVTVNASAVAAWVQAVVATVARQNAGR
jgi:hypothetical protein